MKALCIFLTIAASAAETTGPKPIPPDRYEAISQAMIRYQQAEQEFLAAKLRAMEAEQQWAATLDGLRKEFNAPGCNLTPDKKWICAGK